MVEYTEIDGRKFKQIVWSRHEAMPSCKFTYVIDAKSSLPCPDPGEFDAPTMAGPWADLCRNHVAKVVPPLSSIGYHRIRPVLVDELLGS